MDSIISTQFNGLLYALGTKLNGFKNNTQFNGLLYTLRRKLNGFNNKHSVQRTTVRSYALGMKLNGFKINTQFNGLQYALRTKLNGFAKKHSVQWNTERTTHYTQSSMDLLKSTPYALPYALYTVYARSSMDSRITLSLMEYHTHNARSSIDSRISTQFNGLPYTLHTKFNRFTNKHSVQWNTVHTTHKVQ